MFHGARTPMKRSTCPQLLTGLGQGVPPVSRISTQPSGFTHPCAAPAYEYHVPCADITNKSPFQELYDNNHVFLIRSVSCDIKVPSNAAFSIRLAL
jgi:hypothetical protein